MIEGLVKFDIGPDHGSEDIAVGLLQILIGIEGAPVGMTGAEFLDRLEAGGSPELVAQLRRFRLAGQVMHRMVCDVVAVALADAVGDGSARPPRRAPRRYRH